MYISQVCKTCTSSCAAGEMISGQCNGKTIENSVSCVPCTPGTYSVGGSSTACTQCPGGFYSDYTARECTPCPVGTYSEPNSLLCAPCTDWQCSPGEYRSVCTGSLPGTCSPVPLWTQLYVSPLQFKNTSTSVTGVNHGISYATSVTGEITYVSNNQIPRLSHHTATATSDGIVFIFGGRLSPDNQRSDRLYALRLGYASVPTWWQITTNQGAAVPPVREMHAMAAVGNYLYICGGLGGTLFSGSL
jgi:hypothetical protein